MQHFMVLVVAEANVQLQQLKLAEQAIKV